MNTEVQRVAAYDTEKLLDLLPPEVFDGLNRYQLTVFNQLGAIGYIGANAVEPELLPKHAREQEPDIELWFTHNNSRYNPTIEAAIREDEIVAALGNLRYTNKSEIKPQAYAIALRARRTVVAALAIHAVRS